MPFLFNLYVFKLEFIHYSLTKNNNLKFKNRTILLLQLLGINYFKKIKYV